MIKLNFKTAKSGNKSLNLWHKQMNGIIS